MNDRDRTQLPPMAMLHSFAAAVRFGSFSRAADEVGLTQSAVSRQIANLEEWLGRPLFDRIGRRVVLNARGASYAEEIIPALGQIRRATGRAMLDMPDKTIELATLPSFGMRWLAPRLSRLSEKHPDLVVNIAARSDIFDFAREPFDAAIHVGKADWPNAIHHFLFNEQVVPVISPALLHSHKIASPADLKRVPLLVQSARQDDWQKWFAMAGVDAGELPAPSHISHFLMVAQAVSAGAGAALLPTFLIEAELHSGALVIPFDLLLEDERAYYLVHPDHRQARPEMGDFTDWMLSEAADQNTL